MNRGDDEVVIPVVSEELHVDAVPVQTGSVRVTKRVYSHDELIEQELRTGKVEVKRVRVDRPVDGPQAVVRSGNTLVIPVVSEVLKVERIWVVTEEIYITQTEERKTVNEAVSVNREEVEIERLDREGRVVSERETGAEFPAKARTAGQTAD